MKVVKLWIGILALLYSTGNLAATGVGDGVGTMVANTGVTYTYDAAGNLLTLVTAGSVAAQLVSRPSAYNVNEADGAATLSVKRTGNAIGPISVSYATISLPALQ